MYRYLLVLMHLVSALNAYLYYLPLDSHAIPSNLSVVFLNFPSRQRIIRKWVLYANSDFLELSFILDFVVVKLVKKIKVYTILY